MRLLLVALVLFSVPAHAQGFEWPAEPQNLQVLEGVAGPELGQVMRSFAIGLGVRCTHCHVGEEGQPLTTFDFASDAKPNKEIAREMIRMTQAIDATMTAVKKPAREKASVQCVTCHRGEALPPAPDALIQGILENMRQGGK